MNTVLSAQDISRALSRIAHEICEGNNGSNSITLLGIPTRGAHLAFRLAALIELGAGFRPTQFGHHQNCRRPWLWRFEHQ